MKDDNHLLSTLAKRTKFYDLRNFCFKSLPYNEQKTMLAHLLLYYKLPLLVYLKHVKTRYIA